MYSTSNFSDTEKIACFDRIASCYFNKNFGSISKSDLDLLLFSEYINHCKRGGQNCDDYTLSRQLGITQNRIRSLKERKELKYPYDGFDWKQSFAEAAENARYDENDKRVKFIIQDINVQNELRYFMESHGWYDNYSLNKKLINIQIDCFLDICGNLDEDNNIFTEEAKNRIKKIAGNNSELNEFISDFTKTGLSRFVMSASKELIGAVLEDLPFGKTAKVAIKCLSDIVKNM